MQNHALFAIGSYNLFTRSFVTMMKNSERFIGHMVKRSSFNEIHETML